MKKYVITIAFLYFSIVAFTWLKPADTFSQTERRELAQLPEFTADSFWSGKYMSEFETYAVDQFPLRERMRSIKAMFHKYVLRQTDNKGVYFVEGHISEMAPKLSEKALQKAVKKFESIYETYIKESNAKVYYSIIPDKNFFLAEANGYLAYDYQNLYDYMYQNLDDMTYVEIKELLSIEEYYFTDSHWKQEEIVDVAEHLMKEMGTVSDGVYEKRVLKHPFYGVYYGHLALKTEPDQIVYMTNDVLENCVVRNEEKGKAIDVYDMDLAVGRDPYEMFLGGTLPVITIENPKADTQKELVLFRDSFGSSIAPLFVSGYAKITLLDIRYMNEKMIDQFVDFDDQDVLFLYSTSVLNNETAF